MTTKRTAIAIALAITMVLSAGCAGWGEDGPATSEEETDGNGEAQDGVDSADDDSNNGSSDESTTSSGDEETTDTSSSGETTSSSDDNSGDTNGTDSSSEANGANETDSTDSESNSESSTDSSGDSESETDAQETTSDNSSSDETTSTNSENESESSTDSSTSDSTTDTESETDAQETAPDDDSGDETVEDDPSDEQETAPSDTGESGDDEENTTTEESTEDNSSESTTNEDSEATDEPVYTLTVEAESPVTLERNWEDASTTREPTNGTVEFSVIAGEYTLSADGYEDEVVTIDDNQTVTLATEESQSQTRTLEVSVIDDETDEGIEGATVELVESGSPSADPASYSLTTDSNGMAQEEVKDVSYSVIVHADGYEEGHAEISLGESVTIPMEPAEDEKVETHTTMSTTPP